MLSNVAKNVPMQIRQNSAMVFTLVFKNADGTPKDLTGETFSLSVRKSRQSGSVLLELTSASGNFTIQGAGNNEVVVSISTANTASLPCGCWVYDLDRVGSGIPVIAGSFEVVEDR